MTCFVAAPASRIGPCSLCTTSAFLACTIIVVLFLEAFLSLNRAGVIALLFITAMLTLIAGLLIFLREVFLATASLRIGPPQEP